MSLNSIHEVGKRFGLTSRSLRYYEEVGLVRADRRGSMRVYSREAIETIRWIVSARNLGYSIEEIRDFLRLKDPKPSSLQDMKEILERSERHLRNLEAQLLYLEELRQGILEVHENAATAMQAAEDEKAVDDEATGSEAVDCEAACGEAACGEAAEGSITK